MEYANINKSELSPGKRILLLLLLAVFLAALHISCFFYNNGCFACMVSGGVHPSFNLDLDASLGTRGSFDNDDIYAFTTVPTSLESAASSSDAFSTDASMSLKPLYNSKFRNDEHLVPSSLKLKKLWTSKDWRIKVSIFIDVFSDIMKKGVLKPCVKALCIGAGQGHEVLALKEMGIYNSIGIDLVAAPPLVMKGDMHSQPFRKNTFDFEFCNVFDHALFTSKFAAEIERTLKPGGCVAIHLMLKNRTQEAYRPNNLQSVGVLVALFRNFDILHVGDIDAFGLDTEVIFRKPLVPKTAGLAK
eukprot:c43478_g1_i1 orf=544-1449(+)